MQLPARAPSFRGTVAGSPAARRRVLCVDDDAAICELVARWLSAVGYVTAATTSPEEALAWVRSAPDVFDALVTDQTMPGLTGLELARRAKEASPHLVVILGTALGHAVSESELAEHGVATLLPKPFGLKEIARSLGVALGGSGMISTQRP